MMMGLVGWKGLWGFVNSVYPGDGKVMVVSHEFCAAVNTLDTSHGGLALRKGSKPQLPDLAFLLARSLVVQLTSVGHPSNPSPQEKRLGADISILGGNRTGIYVQWVKPGSRVEKTGLREGCRLIEVSLGTGSFHGFVKHLRWCKGCGVIPMQDDLYPA